MVKSVRHVYNLDQCKRETVEETRWNYNIWRQRSRKSEIFDESRIHEMRGRGISEVGNWGICKLED